MASESAGKEIEDTACEELRRVAEDRLHRYCGSKEERIRSTAISTGLISEGETFDTDFSDVFTGPIDTPERARRLALGIVWVDNPFTDTPLIDEHGGFYDALHEANSIADEEFLKHLDGESKDEEIVEEAEESAVADASEEEVVDTFEEETDVIDEADASDDVSIVEDRVVVEDEDEVHVAEVVEGTPDEIGEHVEEIGEAMRADESDDVEVEDAFDDIDAEEMVEEIEEADETEE